MKTEDKIKLIQTVFIFYLFNLFKSIARNETMCIVPVRDNVILTNLPALPTGK